MRPRLTASPAIKAGYAEKKDSVMTEKKRGTKKKILYMECEAGISGDMTVGMLLDLGADQKVLDKALKSMPLEGFHTEVHRVRKSGIDCCSFDVILEEGQENHDHDMAYLHGWGDCEEDEFREQEEDHHGYHHHHHEQVEGAPEHHYGHHDHEQSGGSAEHHNEHVHRGLTEIFRILNETEMTPAARDLAMKVFRIVARAEAKAHGIPEEQVHFHEVGAVDSIVDVAAAAVCFDDLGITDVIIEELYEGRGTVRCQHGILPIPVPAVTNIVTEAEIPLQRGTVKGEFVTPTGAAIAAAVRTAGRQPERYRIKKTGIGAGKRTYARPSILRGMLIEPADAAVEGSGEEPARRKGNVSSSRGTRTEKAEEGRIWKLETNIDDSTGEQLGFLLGRLFAAGARDAFYTPVFMKKNRPGWMLTVICDAAAIEKMEEMIFLHSSTIGIRRCTMERTVLERETIKVNLADGTVRVKVCRGTFGIKYDPEYEDVAAVAERTGRGFSAVYQEVLNEVQ